MAGNDENTAGRSFRLDMLTPQKTVFSGSVDSLIAPGMAGSFQILRNHAPFLAAIGVGEVKIEDQTGNEVTYSTSGGFVEVNHNVASFLADTVERKEDINIERARAAKERAEERLGKREPGMDVARAQAALARAVNRIRIAEK